MRDLLLIVLCGLFVMLCSSAVYSIYQAGYDQGRNDGFKSGWREAIEAKELPEPPTEDE